MQAQTKTQRIQAWFLKTRAHWLRGLLMLAFFLLLGLLKLAVGFLALFQFGSLLLTGEPNPRLARFGAGLSLYLGDLVAYLLCTTDRLPFPFGEWPKPESNA